MRYAINPDNGLMYEADRGPWVRFSDVEQQLTNATKQNVVLRNEIKGVIGWASSKQYSLPDAVISNLNEALAATADLAGLVVCDADPCWRIYWDRT